MPKHNTDGAIVNCLRQAGQLHYDEKIYARNIITAYQIFGTMTTPSAETKSIGLSDDARAGMVFAIPPRQLYRDETTRVPLPGFSHLDNFIWTRKLASVYRDFTKTTPSADLPTLPTLPTGGQAAGRHRRQQTIPPGR